MNGTKPTRDQVLAEPAGPRLDRWVAEHVMGLRPRPVRARGSTETVVVRSGQMSLTDGVYDADELRRFGSAPDYTSSVQHAWSVVERLAADGWTLDLQWKGAGRQFEHTAEADFGRWVGGDHRTGHAVGDTMPEAVCRAALLAVLARDEGGQSR